MFPFTTQPRTYLGYDAGSDSAKAVTIERHGESWQVTGCHRLKYEDEGVSSSADQSEALAAWRHQNKWETLPTALALPQYQGATVLKDFPPVPTRKLPLLVAGEAKSLSGVSEESFIWDYRQLPSANGRRNPVLISLCRQGAPSEHLRACAWPPEQLPRQMSFCGLALAEAFAFLQPDEAASQSPQLLLDLGRDNTTAVLWRAGQPLYLGSLSVSAGQLAEAANRSLGADQGSPLENLRNFRLTDELDSSPAGRLANQLDSEIQDFVAAWRDQEIPALAQLPIARIWLSGGGALLGGLREWIQTSSDTEVKILSLNAPNVPQDETPLYIIALGLALQATDGKFATRLLPAEMLDSQRHRDNLPLLWAALAIFLIAILFAFTASYLRQSSRLSAIQSQAARLQECGEIIPQLESASTALRLQDERLRPLLVASHQTANLRQAFQALRQASQQDVFLFFLSDHLDSEADNDSFATAQSKTSNDQKRQKLSVLTAEANRQPSTAYFCQGFTPLVNRFEVVRAFTDRLKQDDFFAEVDSPPQKSFPDAEQAQQAWLKFLRQYGDKDFLDFNLVLPLANPTLTSLAGRRD